VNVLAYATTKFKTLTTEHTLYEDGSFPVILMNALSNNNWMARKWEYI